MHFVDAKSLLSPQKGMNIYRGCTHGCIYCDSRSACYSFTHDFEDIEVKQNAPELLEKALRSMRRKCMLSTGAMCDPYLHAEEKLGLTRRCLEIVDRYGYGIAVQTKSTRILRDMDLLASINRKAKCVVEMTLTTADEDLCRILEPHVSTTKERYAALKQFQAAGIPTIVWITPLLPFINDTEENMRALLTYCVDAGVRGIVTAGCGVTLRDGDREYFYAALDRHFPGMKRRYIQTFGNAYDCRSPRDRDLMTILRETCDKNNMLLGMEACFSWMREFPVQAEQLSFF